MQAEKWWATAVAVCVLAIASCQAAGDIAKQKYRSEQCSESGKDR